MRKVSGLEICSGLQDIMLTKRNKVYVVYIICYHFIRKVAILNNEKIKKTKTKIKMITLRRKVERE